MPIFGLGIHVLVAIFFAIHAMRTGREMYWLIILFSFPLLGSVVYFFAFFLPQSQLERGLRTAGKVVQATLDPKRALREAQNAFDLTPTAHNRMRLAGALFDAGMLAEAVAQYDACLSGPFAGDAEIGLGAGTAKLANGQPLDAIAVLNAVRARTPNFRPEQLALLLAKSHAQAGHIDETRAEYEAAIGRFNSVETRAEYALWAIEHGDLAAARRELTEIDHARKHMTRYTRSLHQDVFRRLDAGRAQLSRGG